MSMPLMTKELPAVGQWEAVKFESLCALNGCAWQEIVLTCAPSAPQEIFRFLKNPRKPAILAMSRPDAKKNITTLVKAFGENPTLRELANLVLIMVRTCAFFMHDALQMGPPCP